MSRPGSFYGVIGAILLLFAGVAFYLTRQPSVYVILHTLGGIAAIIAAISSAQGSITTFLGQRSTKYGAGAAFYSLLFLGVLVLVNYLSTRHHYRIDVTEAGIYSLSPQSQNVLRQLDVDLDIDAFVQAGSDPQLRELLSSYAYESDKVTWRMVDPDQRPDLAERFQVTTLPSMVLRYAGRTNVVNRTTEEDLTNGIIKITRSEKKTVYFLAGHDEPNVEDMENAGGYGVLRTALENEGYGVETVVLSSDQAVPEESNLLIVAGAQRSLLPHEIERIDAYLRDAGSALFLLPPRKTPELAAYLQGWGVQVGNDVVVDEQLQLLRGRTFTLSPFAQQYGTHPITNDLSRRGSAALTAYGLSRSVEPHDEPPDGMTPTSLVQTSPNAWAETDLDDVFEKQTVSLDDHDRQGPISLATAVTATLADPDGAEDGAEEADEATAEKAARLVVFGNAGFANNQFIGQYFNRDLVLNTVSWLVGEDELITIRPRTVRASRVQLTPEQGTTVFYLSVLILPEFLLLAGLATWWRRR